MAAETQTDVQHTDHALVVGLGMFGQQIGLFEALDRVRFPGRVYKGASQRKLRELLAALAAGYRNLQDIDLAADAIRDDPLVIATWDPRGFAHYSGVSRAMQRADATTVYDLQAELERISAPFLACDVEEALATGGPLRLEGDTTGLATTADMPGVAPGLIEGRLQPGFQMASLSLRTPHYRVVLSSAHFNGKTVACQTLETLLALAERRVGRPRRRVELLYPLREQCQQAIAQWRAKMDRAQGRAQAAEEREWELHFLIRQTQQEVGRLELDDVRRQGRPYSRVAQARRHLKTYQRWQASARQRRGKAEQQVQPLLERVQAVEDRLQALDARIARYEEDNRTNPQPLEVIFSQDGGFGTPENVALLTELGYGVATKGHGRTATPQLKRDVTPQTVWEDVNAITQATEGTRTQFGGCPYPVRLILTRQQRGERVRYSTLIVSPPDATWGQTATLARYKLGTAESVQFYNRRQDIEAGIKEFKGVFHLGHMRFFSSEAVQIQEQLITFLPNFTRWAIRYYFCPNAIHLPSRADRGLDQLKDVVRVAMHSGAEAHHGTNGCILTFAPKGAFGGLIIDLRQPLPFQLPLPLFTKLPFFESTISNAP
ncbi:MAG: hypothetical protein M5U01_21400 [Ardenticatenaceae bacterium]|nr:hypothetical protein [Ardenticatenaceae bacterium]